MWAGNHNSGNGRFWGYLVDRTDNMCWHYPYYTFWGSNKSEIIHFKKIVESAMKNNFRKNIKYKKEKYICTTDTEMILKIITEFEQLKIISILKRR